MKYAVAKCLDVSEHGIAIEVVEPVIVRSFVTLRSEHLKLAGRAGVRYCRRSGGKYLVGLEFAAGLKCIDLPEVAPSLP
jgi:hypothetical protein